MYFVRLRGNEPVRCSSGDDVASMAFDFRTVACRGPEPRVAPQLGQVRVGVAARENGELLEVRDSIHRRGPSQHVRGHVERGEPSGGSRALPGAFGFSSLLEDFAARRARCRCAGVPAGAA